MIETLLKNMAVKQQAVVSKKTAFVGSREKAGSKLAKAGNWNPVITEDEFEREYLEKD